jgi:predicted glycoside hydrolase/deacetylase ChbG (UPF0249 family)
MHPTRSLVPCLLLSLLAGCAATKTVPSPERPATGPFGLVVRGSVMGALHGINQGITRSFDDGIMRSAEVIVPGPWFPEAVKMLKERPELDVGIHLALSSEWQNARWRPLTRAASLSDDDGYFHPLIRPRADFPPKSSLKEAQWSLEEIEQELRAQLTMLVRHVPRVSHSACHMGCNSFAPEVKALVGRLEAEFGLARDTSGLRPLPIRWPAGTPLPRVPAEQRIAAFVAALESVGPGDYVYTEHPATDDPEMRAIFHTGYENVAADRAAVTALFTSPRVKDVIRRRGITLIGYRDLPKLGAPKEN